MTEASTAAETGISAQGGPGAAEEARRTPGQVLREARERQGHSVRQMANALHLTIHYVDALESDSYDKLPGDVFVRGYIRTYAGMLDLDPDYVLGLYRQFSERRQARKEEAFKRYTKRRKDKNKPWIVVSGLAFVGLAVFLWYLNSQNASSLPAASPETVGTDGTEPALLPEPAVLSGSPDSAVGDSLPPAGQAAAPPLQNLAGQPLPVVPGSGDTAAGQPTVSLDWNGPDVLRLQFSGESWVEVEDGETGQQYSNMLDGDDVLRISGHAPFELLLGDARVIALTFNGRPVDIGPRVREDDTARLTIGL